MKNDKLLKKEKKSMFMFISICQQEVVDRPCIHVTGLAFWLCLASWKHMKLLQHNASL